jgi:hypothetical protein
MNFLEVLRVSDADGIDPGRPLEILSFSLGPDAANEAVRLLRNPAETAEVTIVSEITVKRPLYWTVSRRGAPLGEVFCIPEGKLSGLPTAIEVAIVRAACWASSQEEREAIAIGGCVISIGPRAELEVAHKLACIVDRPRSGVDCALGRYTHIEFIFDDDNKFSQVVQNCIAGSFSASPLKFRFLEIYRVVEARFIREVKDNLLQSFDIQPKAALEEALNKLKSEMSQIVSIAENNKHHFEMIYSVFLLYENENSLATLLLRKARDARHRQDQWALGAALVYYLRCAIVHAGEKDLIFEQFPDGDEFLANVLEHIEEAAFAVAGVSFAK